MHEAEQQDVERGAGREGRARRSLTGSGRVAGLLLLGFMAGAVNTGTNLLFAILGLIASLLLLEARRTRRGLRGVEAARTLPRTVVRGERVAVSVRLFTRDGAPRALPFLVEELDPQQVLDRDARLLLWGLAGDEGGEAAWEAAFLRRGRARLGGLRLTCRGPCGLVEASREVASPDEVLVLPRLRRLRGEGLLSSPSPAAERRPRAFGPERRDLMRSLRELRPGDDPRTIHWRASARRGDLVVREFERAGPEGALVLLDLSPPRGQEEEEAEATVEAAVELTLALLEELLRRGEPAGLGIAGAGPPVLAPPAGSGILARAREQLALAAPAPTGAGVDLQALLRLVQRGARDLRLFLVTTRPAREARSACGGAPLARVYEVPDAATVEAWLVPAARPDLGAEDQEPAPSGPEPVAGAQPALPAARVGAP